MIIYVGIDPGLDGGLVALDEEGVVLACREMPTACTGSFVNRKPKKHKTAVVKRRKPKPRTQRREVNAEALATYLSEIRTGIGESLRCVVEVAHAFPMKGGGGAIPNFAQGMSYGIVRGVLAGLKTIYWCVHAGEWRKAMGVSAPKKEDRKRLSIEEASRRSAWMAACLQEAPKRTRDGLADAYLLATWLRLCGGQRTQSV